MLRQIGYNKLIRTAREPTATGHRVACLVDYRHRFFHRHLVGGIPATFLPELLRHPSLLTIRVLFQLLSIRITGWARLQSSVHKTLFAKSEPGKPFQSFGISKFTEVDVFDRKRTYASNSLSSVFDCGPAGNINRSFVHQSSL